MTAQRITGRWRLTTMELWDPDAMDLVGPAFIEFSPDGTGQLGFIAVHGFLDCRHTTSNGANRVEFTWDGSDEGDPVSGRGWGQLSEDDVLVGRIYFHLGDDSGFTAERASAP